MSLHGGEPLLQLDAGLIGALHGQGFEIGIETNGTIAPPEGIDWVLRQPQGRLARWWSGKAMNLSSSSRK
jgi:organic radical activating enzyme